MATRRNSVDSEKQLDLFSSQRPTHDTADAIRPNGRETLARTSSQDGARAGTDGPTAPDAPGSGGEDQGRNGHAVIGIAEAGIDAATSPRPGLGDGAPEIHPPSSRRVAPQPDEPPKNLNNYRITDGDRLGEGGPKQKFQYNLAAIQTLRAIEAESRPATTEEKATLVRYVGWGAMPQVFDDRNREWAKERTALSEELTQDEYERARSTTLNAHYTSPGVIGAMYRALDRFGFEGGRILEPACGIGHFLGLMPEDLLRRSTVTGIEIDPLTARIAKTLYPDSDIRIQAFEQSKLADGFYDLAISNVPFGDYTVHDPRWNNYKFPIHDYFFAAALDKVRPGGLLIFVTSHHTLDKVDSTLRELLGAKTEMLGAIRLPNNAFKKNAGTEVTTDIVMLRKLRPGEAPTGPAWKNTADYSNDSGDNFTLNEYFAARPEMMLGMMR